MILKRGQNIKFLPYVFTEHGAIMAANVLNSPHAVQMSVFVIRAFVQLRHIVTPHKELASQAFSTPSAISALFPKPIDFSAYFG